MLPCLHFMEGIGTAAAQAAVAYGVQEGLKRAFRSDTGEAKRRRTSSARPTGTANMSYNPTNSPFLRSKGFQRQLSYAQRKRFLSKNKRTGGFAGQEVKFYDETIGSTSLVSNTWSIQSDISTPAQGSSPTERDGRVAFIRSVHGKLFITVPNGNSSTPPGDVIVRMVLIWDTQTNQAALSMTDVMEPAPNDALEFRNLEYSSRFIVLKDKQLTIRVPFQYEAGAYYWGLVRRQISFNKSFKKPIKVRFAATGANINSVSDNSLQLAISALFAPATTVNYTGTTRVRFTG